MSTKIKTPLVGRGNGHEIRTKRAPAPHAASAPGNPFAEGGASTARPHHAACATPPDSPPAGASAPSPLLPAESGSGASPSPASPSASASRSPGFSITSLREGVDVALGLLRAGHSDQRVIAVIRDESGWGEARARRCLDKTYAKLEDLHAERSNRQRLALAVEQRNAILERALADDDSRIALSAMDSRDKLITNADADADATPLTLIDLLRTAQQSED